MLGHGEKPAFLETPQCISYNPQGILWEWKKTKPGGESVALSALYPQTLRYD